MADTTVATGDREAVCCCHPGGAARIDALDRLTIGEERLLSKVAGPVLCGICSLRGQHIRRRWQADSKTELPEKRENRR